MKVIYDYTKLWDIRYMFASAKKTCFRNNENLQFLPR